MTTRTVLLAILAVSSCCCGCDSPPAANKGQLNAGNPQLEDQPEVVGVSEEDATMNAAMERAKRTVGTLIDALAAKNPDHDGYSVKMKLEENGVVEHIWVSDISYANGTFKGSLGNEPENLPSHHLGEPTSVASKDISDWMFTDNDEVVGGFTIHALLAHADAATRREIERIPFRAEQPE